MRCHDPVQQAQRAYNRARHATEQRRGMRADLALCLAALVLVVAMLVVG